MKIKSENQLRELYDLPSERAIRKELSTLDKHAINFIKKSPFLILSTFGKSNQLDASPRGGKAGFVHVVSNNEIIIPDTKGNNRLDSIINIVESGQIGMLFLIPGIDETLRLNGSAYISTDSEKIALFSYEKITPKACIVVRVEKMFLHCAKALMKSKLWLEETKMDRKDLPSMGQMLKDQIGTKEEPESREDMVKRYSQDF